MFSNRISITSRKRDRQLGHIVLADCYPPNWLGVTTIAHSPTDSFMGIGVGRGCWQWRSFVVSTGLNNCLKELYGAPRLYSTRPGLFGHNTPFFEFRLFNIGQVSE